ncbi:MAG: transporter substrate-binding domain-containing protein [Myxococcota bacterium]
MTTRRRDLTWTVAGGLALVLALLLSCASGPPLRVGTSGDYAPFSRDGQGFDIEVARRFAAKLGRPLELVPFRWPELAERAARGDFDVAMSGVTWRADRDVHGWLSLAVGQGGPCWIGGADPAAVGVNRGGVLEGFARARFPKARIVAVDENQSLPELLAAKRVDAIVTDSFEIALFRRPGDTSVCVDETYRKVYWVTPAVAPQLGPALDAFLLADEPALRELRERWFGTPQPRDATDHLVDLVARRLALMEWVGAWKRVHGKPIEDLAQEARVLDAVGVRARELGLDPDGVRQLFALEIQLAKRIQRDTEQTSAPLDLDTELRPALARLSDRQLDALARAAPVPAASFDPGALAPLAPLLSPEEIAALRSALAGVGRAK